MRLARRGDRRLAARRVGDVALEGDPARLRRDLRRSIHVHVQHRHPGPRRRQRASRLRPHAPSRRRSPAPRVLLRPYRIPLCRSRCHVGINRTSCIGRHRARRHCGPTFGQMPAMPRGPANLRDRAPSPPAPPGSTARIRFRGATSPLSQSASACKAEVLPELLGPTKTTGLPSSISTTSKRLKLQMVRSGGHRALYASGNRARQKNRGGASPPFTSTALYARPGPFRIRTTSSNRNWFGMNWSLSRSGAPDW